MRVGIIGGSIAGCAAAALLHRNGHEVTVFERSESDLVSRGAGILMATSAWQDMKAQGLVDGTLPACRADSSRLVTRASGTGQQRWLGDLKMSFTLLNWAYLYQGLRRRVPDDRYRSDAAVERIEAAPHGTTLHFLAGGSLDFDLVVCADGYRSLGRGLIDPGAAPAYRGMVLWRGLLPEHDIRVDALDGCGPAATGSVRAGTTERQLLDPGHLLLSGPQLRARPHVPDRRCRCGGPPFAGSGVLRAVANAISLTHALADVSAVDDALRRWSADQLQAAAQLIPYAEGIERNYVLDMPDLSTMPTTTTNDWVSAAYAGLEVTLPDV
jgi:2-polyprenyl-6-methoxyphenol hydroxylase-like FAD-dependent oxidoreductase